MNEPEELQGLTWEEFNKLLKRLSIFSPEWANYIKIHQNQKFHNVNTNMFNRDWDEGFKGKFELRNLASARCCIVGETYGNTATYERCGHYEDLRCGKCTSYAGKLYLYNRDVNENNSITNLNVLTHYVEHLEKKHKNIKAELSCRNI